VGEVKLPGSEDVKGVYASSASRERTRGGRTLKMGCDPSLREIGEPRRGGHSRPHSREPG